MTDDRIVTAARVEDDAQYEAGLRPRALDDYIGQDRVRENLQVSIAAARQRGEALDHVLLYGPPGPRQDHAGLRHRQRARRAGPVDVRAGAREAGRSGGDPDEPRRRAKCCSSTRSTGCRRRSKRSSYPALEDYELDIVIGQGPSARSVKVPLQKFTLIGATTRAGLLTSPLRARFGIVHRLDFYTRADLEEIVRRSARILGRADRRCRRRREIARRSRGTPRIANRLLRRVRDFAQVRADGHDHAGRGARRR